MRKLDRRDCRILSLVLAGQWYWMIDSGKKTEEYRDRTRYWETRIRKWWRMRFRSPHKMIVEFRFAYGQNAPRMAFEVLSVGSASGFAKHPEWGEPTGPHYVIVLGERVELVNGKEAGNA